MNPTKKFDTICVPDKQQPRKLIDTRQKDGQSDPDKRTYKVILQMFSFYYSTEKEYLEN